MQEETEEQEQGEREEKKKKQDKSTTLKEYRQPEIYTSLHKTILLYAFLYSLIVLEEGVKEEKNVGRRRENTPRYIQDVFASS